VGNRAFSKEEVQWPKKMKKCSTFLTIKEMQIKTTLVVYITHIRKAIIKNTTTNVREDMGIKEHLYTIGRNAN
jgi:hypothetical protein